VPWLTSSQLSTELSRALCVGWRSFVNTFQGGHRLFYRSTLCGRTCIRGWPRSFVTYRFCANFSLYVKIMPVTMASPSMHLNPYVWLPNLRIVATLSKRSMIVFFTSTVEWLTLFNRFLILAIWSHQIRMTAKILQSGNILLKDKLTITLCYFGKNYLLLSNIIYFMHTVLIIMDVSYGCYPSVIAAWQALCRHSKSPHWSSFTMVSGAIIIIIIIY